MKIVFTPTADQVKAFNDSLAKEKVMSSRVIVILASLLFFIYSIIDFFGLSHDNFSNLLIVRAINIGVLSTVFYLTFKTYFNKHYNKILLFGYYASGVTLIHGAYLSKSTDYSYDSYYGALMILVITCCTWGYLPIKQVILMSLVFIGAYIFIKLGVHNANYGDELLIVIAHFFFLISVVVIGSIAQCIRDSVIYKNLKLQEDMKEIIDAKTLEAKRQRKLANLDALTGIPNRRYVTKQLQESISKLDCPKIELIVFFIDLNGFKAINDTFGHDSGDKVLEVTAKRLQQSIRQNDCLARLGGDEFLLGIKVKKPSDKVVEKLVKDIKKRVGAPIAFNGHFLQVGVSIGCAHYPKDGKDVHELIKAADENMYIDKRIKKEAKLLVLPK